jgi:hypothetical protein
VAFEVLGFSAVRFTVCSEAGLPTKKTRKNNGIFSFEIVRSLHATALIAILIQFPA